MALVLYRVSGAAADQTLETRLFQIGGHRITIAQDPKRSASLSTLLHPQAALPGTADRPGAALDSPPQAEPVLAQRGQRAQQATARTSLSGAQTHGQASQHHAASQAQAAAQAAEPHSQGNAQQASSPAQPAGLGSGPGSEPHAQSNPRPPDAGAGAAQPSETGSRAVQPPNGRSSPAQAPGGEHLEHVGLVVWQSAFVLAEYLLQRPPFGGWSDVRAVDLGSGTGVVGIALALAGADVVLTDLPHVTPLTQRNVDANCRQHRCRAQVVDYAWGESLAPLGPKPDLITGADVVYQQEHFEALTDTICRLSDSHTLTYLAFRKRGRREHVFEELLEQRGLAVVTIPKQYLHEEYRDGDYKLLRICKLGP